MDKGLKELLDKLPTAVKEFYISRRNITEIRIRKKSDITVISDCKNCVLTDTFVSAEMLDSIFLSLCDYTISAYEDQIANGFITLAGGHRVGIAGRFSKDIEGKTLITELISLNIRLSCFHSVHINDEILDFHKGLLICGKPHSGKTTFIRNLCRCFNGENYTVCDERNEIYHENLNGDFIINLPKAVAIMQAVRVMSPRLIVCDEIGTKAETDKILEYMHSGVKFVCSVHCDNFEDLKNKPNITPLITAGVFDKFILLDNKDNKYTVKEIKNV